METGLQFVSLTDFKLTHYFQKFPTMSGTMVYYCSVNKDYFQLFIGVFSNWDEHLDVTSTPQIRNDLIVDANTERQHWLFVGEHKGSMNSDVTKDQMW